jgi:GTPase involved in cell partitioning and DNA repair
LKLIQISTLLDFKYKRNILLVTKPGANSRKDGKDGEDIIKVPVGTTIKDAETGSFARFIRFRKKSFAKAE